MLVSCISGFNGHEAGLVIVRRLFNNIETLVINGTCQEFQIERIMNARVLQVIMRHTNR